MDKRLILAVAGSGKTSHIISQLTHEKRALIITHTNNNIFNIRSSIIKKFGYLPKNITLMSYFSFLFSFCYRPLLLYRVKVDRISYDFPPRHTMFLAANNISRYYHEKKGIYSNRITKLFEVTNILAEINSRIERYYDVLFIDEIQDFAGHDFNFLKSLTRAQIPMLFVGDFYQHTFETSNDGSVNKSLYNNYDKYKKILSDFNISIDTCSLSKSYRCGSSICAFISDRIGITIQSVNTLAGEVILIDIPETAENVYYDTDIVKLFYENHTKYSCFSNNWGASKGIDSYYDVCVVLNSNSFSLFRDNNLISLPPRTRNKLYVACSRARNKLYIVPEKFLKKFKNK